jgi:hypothetical protein
MILSLIALATIGQFQELKPWESEGFFRQADNVEGKMHSFVRLGTLNQRDSSSRDLYFAVDFVSTSVSVPKPDDKLVLYFWSAGYGIGYKYDQNRENAFVADQQRFGSSNIDFTSKISVGQRSSTTEGMAYTISYTDFLKLASAGSAEGKLGDTRFTLSLVNGPESLRG